MAASKRREDEGWKEYKLRLKRMKYIAKIRKIGFNAEPSLTSRYENRLQEKEMKKDKSAPTAVDMDIVDSLIRNMQGQSEEEEGSSDTRPD